MNSFIKLILEILPLIIFFTLYKQYGIIYGTTGVLIATIVAQVITYYFEKKCSVIQLIATAVLVIFGSITIFSGDSKFIKLKPTIINLIFALILFIGTLKQRGLLKHIFSNAITMEEKHWIVLSQRWACFFLCVAILNEIIWRNFPEDIWVQFKVFGILGLTFLFLLTQLKFMNKNNLHPQN
jgi:intracellular septation protein